MIFSGKIAFYSLAELLSEAFLDLWNNKQQRGKVRHLAFFLMSDLEYL